MKVWIISYSNPKRGSGYICDVFIDYEKAATKYKYYVSLDPINRYQFDEFLVSE